MKLLIIFLEVFSLLSLTGCLPANEPTSGSFTNSTLALPSTFIPSAEPFIITTATGPSKTPIKTATFSITLTQTPSEKLESLKKLLKYKHGLWDFRDLLSPDGRWIFYWGIIVRPEDNFRVFSTTNPDTEMISEPLIKFGKDSCDIEGDPYPSWSPDSTAFVAACQDVPGLKGLSRRRAVIFKLSGGGKLTHSVFELPGDEEYFEIQWSPDGTEIALNHKDTFYIIDKNANLLRTIKIPVNPRSIEFRWYKKGIFYITQYLESDYLYWLDLEKPTSQPKFIYGKEGFFINIESYDPGRNRLLVYNHSYNIDSEHNKLFVISVDDPGEKQEIEIPLSNSTIGPNRADTADSHSGYIAFNIHDNKDETGKDKVYIFDWSTMKMTGCGNRWDEVSLIGWYQEYGGLLVVRYDGKGKNVEEYFDIIHVEDCKG
jgi:hypothetical protein